MTSPFRCAQAPSADQLVGQQVHREGVDPAPVTQSLVPPEPADRPETDPGVGRDGTVVVGRRVDRQAVVAGGEGAPATMAGC
jgi:hypothetical protein